MTKEECSLFRLSKFRPTQTREDARMIAEIYPYVLSPGEVNRIYQVERLLFMRWYERLLYWCRVTIRVLLGELPQTPE